METKQKIKISKDSAAKKISVIKEFDADLGLVWKAWTESALLDQWWAPRPWKAETRTMSFREGGQWLYAMKGPNGEKIWSLVEFHSIIPRQSFQTVSSFCDENGVKDSHSPGMQWKIDFISVGENSRLEAEISFKEESDFKKIIDMGFEGGFSMALGNLDELLGTTH